MKRRLLAAGTALSAIATAAAAQQPVSLAPIIVSAGLTPLQAERYGRSVTVIDGAEIRERGILSVQDALRSVPGVSVTGTGHSFTNVRIRGGEANHTLILIDGVEAAGGDGDYVLTGLEAVNVERIEVLRGPQSVYYGSNASAGVINIITRKGGPGLQYGGGFDFGGGWAANAFASYRDARGGVALSLTKRDDEGWDYSGSDGEKDGIERQTLQLSGDYEVAEGLTLGFTYRVSDETYDYDGTNFSATGPDDYVVDDPTQYSDRDERTAQVYAEYVTPDGRAAGRLSWERTDLDQSYNGGAMTDTDSEAVKLRLSYGLTGPVDAGGHVVSVMVEREEDSSSANPAYTRENRSVALEYRATLADVLDLQLGVRHDDNSAFGDSTTWNVGASWQLANGMRIHASAGTGVVNPTYFELYANAFGYVGNPALDPEHNRSFDIGVEVPFAGGRGLVDVTYFNETLTDEITAVSTGTGFTYINQSGDSDREGIEVQGRYDATDALSLRLAYTYLDAENPDGSVELRRPMHELGLGATWRGLEGRATLSADARYVAGNYDSLSFPPYGSAELPDYWKVDIAGTYQVTDTVMLNARIENLFDAEYSDTWGYASRGRTAYIGVSSRW